MLAETKAKCKGSVMERGTMSYFSKACTYNATLPSGYCRLHDPHEKSKKRQARHDKWDKDWKAKEQAVVDNREQLIEGLIDIAFSVLQHDASDPRDSDNAPEHWAYKRLKSGFAAALKGKAR